METAAVGAKRGRKCDIKGMGFSLGATVYYFAVKRKPIFASIFFRTLSSDGPTRQRSDQRSVGLFRRCRLSILRARERGGRGLSGGGVSRAVRDACSRVGMELLWMWA